MNPKITVIIPTLNVVNYIKECLDSIINQTLYELEILIIDANSTDGTYEILKEYAQRDKRIQLLEDKMKSTGYAKNLGIDKAKAPYISIIESDDYVELDMMEKLYQKAEETGADIIKGGFDTFIGNGKERFIFPKMVPQDRGDYEKILRPREDIQCFRWVMFEWLGLYRKSFLNDYSIRHNESPGAAYQDIGFWFLSFSYASKVYLIKDVCYHYRFDNPNASVKSRDKVFQSYNEYKFIREKLQSDYGIWEQVYPAFCREFYRSNEVVYNRLIDELKPILSNKMHEVLADAEEKHKLDQRLFEEEEREKLICLLRTPRLFDQYCTAHQANQKKLFMQLKEKCNKFPFIVIFGAGSYGTNLHYALRKADISIAAYADNDQFKWGSSLNGLNICSVERCESDYPACLYLIANKRYGTEIAQGLIDKGVGEYRIEVCNTLALIGNLI